MKQFDLTSDLHLDFWIPPESNPTKFDRLAHALINKIIPEFPNNTLVIAGDIGHYNKQNIDFIEVLKEYYLDIVLVFGNHDLYMVSNSVEKKYKNDSFSRLADFIESCSLIDGVHFLDGNGVEVDDIRYVGTGGFYDNSYAKDMFHLGDQQIYTLWRDNMNDAKLIKVPGKLFRYLELAQDEYAKLDKVITSDVDVVVTHISPDHRTIPQIYNKPTSTFYQFNGSDLLDRLKPGSVWCYGHTHEVTKFVHPKGCMMLSNPLGYSFNRDWIKYDFPDAIKIKAIDVGEIFPSYDELFEETK